MSVRARWMQRRWAEAEGAYRRLILDSLEPQPSARLLDLGCDDGEWTDVVRRRLGVPPEQVSGLELVEARAAIARTRGFDVHHHDLDEEWPFEDASFDVVHANQVIEHVGRLDHFVEETRRVVRPGGRVVVCTENLASWHNVAALSMGYQPFSLTNISTAGPIGNPLALHAGETPTHESWQHVHVVSLKALRDLFVAHGLLIQATWGAGYHPLAGRLASRLAAADAGHAHFIGIVADKKPQRHTMLTTLFATFYVLLPFDVIPDVVPIVGHFDDAIVVALAVQAIRRGWFDKLRRFIRRNVLAEGCP